MQFSFEIFISSSYAPELDQKYGVNFAEEISSEIRQKAICEKVWQIKYNTVRLIWDYKTSDMQNDYVFNNLVNLFNIYGGRAIVEIGVRMNVLFPERLSIKERGVEFELLPINEENATFFRIVDPWKQDNLFQVPNLFELRSNTVLELADTLKITAQAEKLLVTDHNYRAVEKNLKSIRKRVKNLTAMFLS